MTHFLLVNPHVIPFIRENPPDSLLHRAGSWAMGFAVQEVYHRLCQLSDFGVMPVLTYQLRAILSQKYVGDITIFPKVDWSRFLSLLSNLSDEVVASSIKCGEQSTWPSILLWR
jgi:TAG lipase/steryl ester hydrolase/phospholipase A2/LPA acyltransferase